MSDSSDQEREEAAGLRPEDVLLRWMTLKKDKKVDPSIKLTHSVDDVDPQTHRPPSPVPSCVSMKSDASMGGIPNFSSEPVPSGLHPQTHRPPSPVPSCVSMKSDASMGGIPNFSSEPVPSGLKLRADLTQDLGPRRHLHTGHTPGRKRELDEDLGRVIKNHKASLKRRFENISEGIIKPGAEILLNKIYTELYITGGESEGVNKEHEVWQVESASRSQSTEDISINCNDIFKPLLGLEKHIRTVMTKGVAGIGKTVSVQKFILDWTDGVANHDVDFMFPLSFRELNLVRRNQYSLHSLLLDFHPELKELNDGEGYKDCQVVFIFDGLDESRLTLDLEQNSELSDVKETSSVDVMMTSLIQGTLLPSALIWITSRPAAASQIPAQFIDQVTEVRGFNDPQKEEYFRKRIRDQSQANRIISHIQTSRSLHIMCHIPVFCWIAATVLQQMLERKNIKDIPKTLTEMFIHFLLIQTTRKDQKYQSGSEKDTKKLLESQRNILLKLAELAFKNLENGNLMFYEEDLRECGIDVSEASVYSGMCTEIFKTENVESQKKKVYCFVHLSVQEFLAAVFVFHSYLEENHEALESLFSDERRNELNPSMLYSFQSALRLKPQDNLHVLLKSAVDKALESQNGHLDLFLRFLMGISVENNHRLLQGLLSNTHNSSHSIKETCQYMKKLNREGLSPERCINLFHCLFEMNDDSMHKEIQTYLSSPKNIKQKLSPAHCSALAHMLLMSEEVLDEIELKKYNTSDEGRRRLLPAVRCCRKARLAGCNLSEKSCGIVAAVLQSPNSLIELDLSHNDLGDSGVHLLSMGLSSPHCKLQTLRFADCKLTDKSCEIVTSVLQSTNSLLQLELNHNDLGDSGVQLLSKGLSSFNCKIHTLSGPETVSAESAVGAVHASLPREEVDGIAVVEEPDRTEQSASADVGAEAGNAESESQSTQDSQRLYKSESSDNQEDDQAFLEDLPQVAEEANAVLGKALTSEELQRALQSMECGKAPGLDGLSVDFYKSFWPEVGDDVLAVLRDSLITEKGCGFLASALTSNPSHLKELDLSYNHHGESGLKLLSARLEDPACKLEILKTDHASLDRARPRLLRFSCEFTLDPNTAHRELLLSEGNRKVTRVREEQPYPDHPDRFTDHYYQVLSREPLTGRCYWEWEWSGDNVAVGVAYKSISRREGIYCSPKAWCLVCSSDTYRAWHNGNDTVLPVPPAGCRRVGVYVDREVGTLSFYRVSSDTLTHLHTFTTTSTSEPLHAVFCVFPGSSVSLI
ncbi:NACHT, LRR and PYD domains-containing protein 3-like [Sardina pilchardus]|uniref:NACHT, LRR and PYD domains-containing protein 3-like n=1 Tax=Sardina pilchardus TaxID=27697 RepID=UPI002E0F3564